MSSEDSVAPQVSWSPAELPETTAKALQDKEEARAKRGAKKAAAALAETVAPEGGAEAAPVKKRRGRPPKNKLAQDAAAAPAPAPTRSRPVPRRCRATGAPSSRTLSR